MNPLTPNEKEAAVRAVYALSRTRQSSALRSLHRRGIITNDGTGRPRTWRPGPGYAMGIVDGDPWVGYVLEAYQ